MKTTNYLFALITFTLLTNNLVTYSQGCLPEGIVFQDQDEIDSFQADYPGCTEIEGNVQIDGTYIYNLNGLGVLTSIGGYLIIGDSFGANPFLTDLSGLENITSIGGKLKIYNNIGLVSTSGLDNVTDIGGELEISGNELLEDIDGLINVSVIHGTLRVNYNNSLSELTEFEMITSVEDHLQITYNDAITSLDGLENITSVGTNLLIKGNSSLTNLSGLDGIATIGNMLIISENLNLINLVGLENITYVQEDLIIKDNPSIISCMGLNNLSGVNSYLEIRNNDAMINLTGLENLWGLRTLWIADNDSLQSIEELESLTNVDWSIIIEDNILLESLDGLQNIATCESMSINNNNSLQSLSGLDSFSQIGTASTGLAIRDNDSLNSLNGLENLISIYGYLILENNPLITNLGELSGLNVVIGDFEVKNNNSLNSFLGLSNLTSIEGQLIIENNDALTNLQGLNYINTNVITNLQITGNNLLTTCDIESICYIVTDFNSSVSIMDNAPGCNSPEEIKEVCIYCLPNGIAINTQQTIDNFKSYYPNCSEIGGYLKINGGNVNNLDGLNGIQLIDGALEIKTCDSLKSLSGLDNIEASSIDELNIYANDSLSTCHIQSVCDYLASPNGSVNISNNATGCDSPVEVEGACITGTEENVIEKNDIQIFPNPAKKTISIICSNQTKIQQIKIFNQTGILSIEENNPENKVDVSGLKLGLYFVEIRTETGIVREKLIIQ